MKVRGRVSRVLGPDPAQQGESWVPQRGPVGRRVPEGLGSGPAGVPTLSPCSRALRGPWRRGRDSGFGTWGWGLLRRLVTPRLPAFSPFPARFCSCLPHFLSTSLYLPALIQHMIGARIHHRRRPNLGTYCPGTVVALLVWLENGR